MSDVSERLYKRYRIKKRNDIKSFFGNKKNTSFLSSRKNIYNIIVKVNDCDDFRFAVSVKKSRACAPIRNREKRIVREIFRKNKDSIAKGYDYFVIVNNCDKLLFDYRARNLLSALSKRRFFS